MTQEQPSQQPRQMVGNLRVIDQGAFDELSKRLEHLISDAAESSRRVERLVHSATETSGGAEKARTELDQRLVLAGRVLKITREQLERIKSSLVELGTRQRDIDDVASKLRDQLASFQDHLTGAVDAVDRRVSDAVGGLEGQIDAIHEQLGETAESVGRRAAEAVADLAAQRQATEQAQARAERVLGAAAALGERFADLERRVAAGVGAFEKGLQDAVAEIRTGGAAAERASSKLDEQVFALKSRVAAFAEGLEKWIKPTLAEIDARRQDVDRATAELGERFEALDRRFDDAVKALDERLGAALDDARRRQEQAEASARRLGDGLAGLEARVDEGSASVREAVADRLTELRRSLDGAVAGFEETFRPAFEEITAGAEVRTAAVRETVLDQGQSLLAKLDDAMRRLEARIDGAAREIRDEVDRAAAAGAAGVEARIDAATEQSAQRAQEVMGGMENRFRRLADDAVAHRAQILDTQKDLGASLERIGQQLGAAAETLAHHAEGSDSRSSALQERISQLRTDLAAMVDRMPRMEPALAALEKLNRRGSKIDEKLESRLGSLETRLKSIDDRIAVRMGEAIERLASFADQAQREGAAAREAGDERQSAVNETLRDLRSELGAAHERLSESLGGMVRDGLREFQERGSGADEQAAAARDRILEGQGQLFAALGRLQERLSQLAEAEAGRDAHGSEAASRLEETLATLAGRIEGLGEGVTSGVAERVGRVADEVAEAMEEFSHRQAGDTERLTTIEQRIGQITASLDKVAGTSGGIAPALAELRSQVGAMAAGQLSAQERGQRALTDAIEQRIGTLVTRIEKASGTSAALAPALTELRTQLGALATSQQAALDKGQRAVADAIEKQMAAVVARIEKASASSAALAPALAELRTQVGALAAGQQSAQASQLAAIEKGQKSLSEAIAQKISAVASSLDDMSGAGDVIAPALAELRSEIAGLAEAQLTAMERRIDDVGERIGELAGRLAEDDGDDEDSLATVVAPALAELRSEIAGLAGAQKAAVEQGRRGLAEAVDRLQHRLGQIEEQLQRPDGTEGIAEVVGDVRSEIASLGERLGGRVEAAVAAISSPREHAAPAPSAQVAGLASTLERHLDSIQEQVSALGVRLADFEPAADREAAAPPVDPDELVRRVEEKMSALLEDSREKVSTNGHAAGSGEIERHLSYLGEQVTALGARLANFEMPGPGGTPSPLPDPDKLSNRLDELRDELIAATARIDERLRTAPQPGPGPAGGTGVSEAVSGRLDDLQKQLSLATERLDTRVSEILAAIESRPAAAAPAAAASSSPARPPAAAPAPAPSMLSPGARGAGAGAGTGTGAPAKRSGGSILGGGSSDSRRLINSLIAAINSGTDAVLSEFIAREYAESALAERGVEERVGVYMSFHEEAGEIGLRKIERSTETTVIAVVQETGSIDQYRFTLELEQDPPHKIRVVNIDMV